MESKPTIDYVINTTMYTTIISSRSTPRKIIKIRELTYQWITDVSQEYYEREQTYLLNRGYVLDKPKNEGAWGGLYLQSK